MEIKPRNVGEYLHYCMFVNNGLQVEKIEREGTIIKAFFNNAWYYLFDTSEQWVTEEEIIKT